MEKEVISKFSLIIKMGQIESGPPLSTILGNVGVNSVKFCKELNELINELPIYFFLELKVFIFFDKSYSFFICEPSAALLLRLVSKKKEKNMKLAGGLKKINIDCVSLEDLFFVSYIKFGNCLDCSLKSILGTMFSLKLNVIK